jgi:hypothetical protein
MSVTRFFYRITFALAIFAGAFVRLPNSHAQTVQPDAPLAPPTVSSYTPLEASVDADVEILIDGNGFTNDTQVDLNSTSLTVIFNSSTSLTAKLPPGTMRPGVYQLRVINPPASTGTTIAGNFTVTPGVPVAVDLSPSFVEVAANGLQTFSALVIDQFGNDTQNSVSWFVSPSAGSINTSNGNALTLRAATTAGVYHDTIEANFASLQDTASVTITPAALALLTISPKNTSVVVGGTRQFSVTGRDAYNNIIANPTVTWSVNGGAGSVNSGGLFTASNTPGVYPNSVRASAGGGISATANVTVTSAPPSNVVITPSPAVLSYNGTRLFTATVFNTLGQAMPGASVNWSLSSASVGSILSSGPLTALLQAGTTTVQSASIRATTGDVTGTASIVVLATKMQISAAPQTLVTNGISETIISVTVTDFADQPVGTGTPVTLALSACAGTCNLTPPSGLTDANGRFFATLRSTNMSLVHTLVSTITVNGGMPGVGTMQSINITGSYSPRRIRLPIVLKHFTPNNHTACQAQFLDLPGSFVQPPNNAYNIYRVTAETSVLNVVITNYIASGKILVYKILADTCASNGQLSLQFIEQTTIATTSFQRVLSIIQPNESYLIAINTTGGFTDQPYTISVSPFTLTQ